MPFKHRFNDSPNITNPTSFQKGSMLFGKRWYAFWKKLVTFCRMSLDENLLNAVTALCIMSFQFSILSV